MRKILNKGFESFCAEISSIMCSIFCAQFKKERIFHNWHNWHEKRLEKFDKIKYSKALNQWILGWLLT